MKTKEEPRAMSTVPTATIKIDGWWNHPERHGAMFDLAASEDVKLREGEVKVIPLGIRMKLPEGHFGLVVPRSSTCLKRGIMMTNSVGIIEPDYCGDSDVWGFVAYAIRDTVIERGPRIAQFMPVRMFGDLDFDVVDSMPDPDRGGYGSTGEKSAEGHTAEGCPHDCDGVPIEVGDVLYQTTFEGKPIGDPMEVKRYTGNALFVKGLALPINAWSCTHREPADSYERIADDIETRYENHAFISKSTLCEWSDRIRKLSKKEGE